MIDVGGLWSGDNEYFRTLVETHGPLVMGVARAYGESADHANDLFQETWILVWEKRRSYRGKGSFEAWLNRLANNVCRDDHRRGIARRKGLDRLKGAGRGGDLTWRSPDSAAGLEGAEFRHELTQALDVLPLREREAVVRKFLKEQPDEGIAEAMGVRKATVRSTVRHGMKRLREILKEPEP